MTDHPYLLELHCSSHNLRTLVGKHPSIQKGTWCEVQRWLTMFGLYLPALCLGKMVDNWKNSPASKPSCSAIGHLSNCHFLHHFFFPKVPKTNQSGEASEARQSFLESQPSLPMCWPSCRHGKTKQFFASRPWEKRRIAVQMLHICSYMTMVLGCWLYPRFMGSENWISISTRKKLDNTPSRLHSLYISLNPI